MLDTIKIPVFSAQNYLFPHAHFWVTAVLNANPMFHSKVVAQSSFSFSYRLLSVSLFFFLFLHRPLSSLTWCFPEVWFAILIAPSQHTQEKLRIQMPICALKKKPSLFNSINSNILLTFLKEHIFVMNLDDCHFWTTQWLILLIFEHSRLPSCTGFDL